MVSNNTWKDNTALAAVCLETWEPQDEQHVFKGNTVVNPQAQYEIRTPQVQPSLSSAASFIDLRRNFFGGGAVEMRVLDWFQNALYK